MLLPFLTVSENILLPAHYARRLRHGRHRLPELLDLLSAVTNNGCAVVMATHDLELAARADDIICIAEGRIRGSYQGLTPADLLQVIEAARHGQAMGK
ncbi:hypothetical protein KEM60_02881 [Austwickia sp. TVS 96-490-7B]|nr:hypothetical protein [Austwickia sp. TVS 96-490-7B]